MLIRFIANRISFIINYCPKYVEWNELDYEVVGGKGGLENVGHQMRPETPAPIYNGLCHNGRLVTGIMCGI